MARHREDNVVEEPNLEDCSHTHILGQPTMLGRMVAADLDVVALVQEQEVMAVEYSLVAVEQAVVLAVVMVGLVEMVVASDTGLSVLADICLAVGAKMIDIVVVLRLENLVIDSNYFDIFRI